MSFTSRVARLTEAGIYDFWVKIFMRPPLSARLFVTSEESQSVDTFAPLSAYEAQGTMIVYLIGVAMALMEHLCEKGGKLIIKKSSPVIAPDVQVGVKVSTHHEVLRLREALTSSPFLCESIRQPLTSSVKIRALNHSLGSPRYEAYLNQRSIRRLESVPRVPGITSVKVQQLNHSPGSPRYEAYFTQRHIRRFESVSREAAVTRIHHVKSSNRSQSVPSNTIS